MRISHEAIYQSLLIEGRGALKRELVACLRTGRALREPRSRSRNKPQGHVTADVVLSERSAEAGDRAVPGHWEGDLIIGTGRSAIGTLVERSSRSTLLVHLPRMEGWGEVPPVRNGPPLGGYGAVAMNTALTEWMTKLPQQLRKTVTWDRGKELSGHAQFALETGTKVCSSPIRTRPGSDPRTRTRTGCCVSTSRRARTCPGGPPGTSKPSPWRSTTGPARSLAGRPRPRSSPSSSAHYNSPVLQRPVELARYTSREFGDLATEFGVCLSVGRTGQCWDNAFAESFFATLKRELIGERPWPSRAATRTAIFEWIEGWYKLRRLHSTLGYRSPADYETTLAAWPTHRRCPSKRSKLTPPPTAPTIPGGTCTSSNNETPHDTPGHQSTPRRTSSPQHRHSPPHGARSSPDPPPLTSNHRTGPDPRPGS